MRADEFAQILWEREVDALDKLMEFVAYDGGTRCVVPVELVQSGRVLELAYSKGYELYYNVTTGQVILSWDTTPLDGDDLHRMEVHSSTAQDN